MSSRKNAAVLALVATILAPAIAEGQVGIPGCTNLPDYNRALGALQGMTSACDMTVEQARRIVAEHDGLAAEPAKEPPAPRAHHRRHGERAPQP